MAAFFSGGLNYERVHDLFSTVSQYHRLEIMPMVVKVAEKRGERLHIESNYTFVRLCTGYVSHLE